MAVRGVAGLSAAQRADAIEERMLALARDPAFDPATLQIVKDPLPFVRQRSLGDFAVNYELTSILDVFNEYGVQIMTPAYEGDTPEPKVVPRERWNAAPGRRPVT